MNFLSINIRGVLDPEKAKWIKGIKRSHKLNFICMQETKVSDIELGRASSYWGNECLDYDFVSSHGRSGGLLNLWDPRLFTKSSSYKSRYLLLTSGKIKGLDQTFHILNLYAPQNLAAKYELWNEVISLKSNNQGIWIILGDFNSVRTAEERNNSSFNSVCARNFNDFIFNADLT